MANMLGGFGETMYATKETQKICDHVKCKVEEKTNKAYEEFRAVKYSEQVVAGKNLIIKVHVGGVNYIHLRVFQALQCNGGKVVLHGVQQHQTKDNALILF